MRVDGEFHVIKLDGMFHVAFQPNADREWLRIVASFYNYERAWHYCEVERCMDVDGDSYTGDEEAGGRSNPPVQIDADKPMIDFDLPGLVRGIMGPDGCGYDIPKPRPFDTEHPDADEMPRDYHERMRLDAMRDIAKAADDPKVLADLPDTVVSQLSNAGQKQVAEARAEKATEDDEPLGERQLAAYNFLTSAANPAGLVEASQQDISKGAGVPLGSMGFIIESLERRGLIELVERGKPTRKGVFRVKPNAPVAA